MALGAADGINENYAGAEDWIFLGTCGEDCMATSEEFRRLAQYGVATIYEAGQRRGLIDIELRQIIRASRVAGPAYTVLLGPKGNRAVHEAMKYVAPGEVLVIAVEEPEPIALIGELLALQAKKAGVAGILIDGAVRDLDAIGELGLPIWARWVRARGAAKNDVSSLDIPVEIGGVVINPGDTVILDSDGGVVVSEDRVGDILMLAEQREKNENAVRPRLAGGEFTFDLYGLGKE